MTPLSRLSASVWDRKEFMAAGKLKKFHLGSMLGPVNGTIYFSSFPFPAVAGGGVSQKERPTHNMSRRDSEPLEKLAETQISSPLAALLY